MFYIEDEHMLKGVSGRGDGTAPAVESALLRPSMTGLRLRLQRGCKDKNRETDRERER